MSEERAVYNAGNTLPVNLGAFKNRPCAQPYASGQYVPPVPEEVAQLINLAGWSQTDAAKLVGVNFNTKGSTTIRKWKTSVDREEYRAIPYAAWRHFLSCAGVISVDDDLVSLNI